MTTMTAPITSVSEALKLLNTLVERGEAMQFGVTRGRWIWQEFPETPNRKLAFTLHGQERSVLVHEYEDLELRKPDRDFIENARSLVPAMVKGAEAVLKLKKDLDGHAWCPPDKQAKDRERGAAECCDHVIVILARDYQAALVELGWWK